MANAIKLTKFDMSNIEDDKVVVLIGKRETGKSYLVKDLLYHHQDMPAGTVISGTEGANSFYSKMMPSCFIHGEYNESIIANYLNRQKKITKAWKQQMDSTGDSNTDPRGFLILDDCLYDQSWVKSKDVRSLFMNGRHYKSMFIITMQYALGIPPNLRTNIDYVFLLRENIVRNRKQLYEQYAGMFPSFEVFAQVMDQCTENYECLVIHNNAKSNKLQDQVFWYKASPHEDFQIGHPEFWKYHNANFDPDHDNNEEEFDPLSVKKKKGCVINVKKEH
tara:strand:- start:824 stop:1654 length:831 start_codon:yes stop_codon:yes gene_type:complete